MDFQGRVFNRSLDLADLSIKRAVIDQETDDAIIDSAVYGDVRANHTVTENGDGTWTVTHVDTGTDVLRNIERLVFTDESVDLISGGNTSATGTIDLSTMAPVEDVELSLTPAFADADGLPAAADITYAWQWADNQGTWTTSATGADTTFTPGDVEAGRPLRVVATFTDDSGVLESITSPATAPVKNVNDEPTGFAISPLEPSVGDLMTATEPVDVDGTQDANGQMISSFVYQWQSSGNGGASWQNINGTRSSTFTPTAAQAGLLIRARVKYTDAHGTAETVFSQASTAVGMVATAPGAPTIGNATAGDAEATVRWTAPTNTGNLELTGYEIQVQTPGGAPVGTPRSAGPGATSLVVDGLTNGTGYRFVVRAVNLVGPSPYSAPSNTVTPFKTPTVVSSTPVDGATNVAVGSNLQVFFSEAVTGYDGNMTLTRVSDGSTVSFTRAYYTADNRLLVNPFGGTASTLAPNTQYRLTLTGGPSAIRSLTGTPLATTTITFTTLPAAPAPTVLSTTPVDGATNVAVGSNLQVFFSEAVTGYGGSNVRLTKVSDNTNVPLTRAFYTADNRLLVNPFGGAADTLEAGTEYRLTLTGGPSAIRSLTGTPLATTTITFTTLPAAPAPTVLSTTPVDGATNVAVGSNLQVFFSEAITGHGTSTVRITKVSDDTNVPLTMAFYTSNNRLLVNPFGGAADTLEAGTEYRLTLTGGPSAIRSLTGTPLATTTVTFTTAP